MFGYFERSPFNYSDPGVERRLSRKFKKMVEDVEFSRRFAEFLKENEKKDKDKKDDKKKEDNKVDKVKEILSTLGLLTILGPFVGLAQLKLLLWLAEMWQTALPHVAK